MNKVQYFSNLLNKPKFKRIYYCQFNSLKSLEHQEEQNNVPEFSPGKLRVSGFVMQPQNFRHKVDGYIHTDLWM